MGFYVHIHVCFACDNNEPVAELAKRHLPALHKLDIGDGERAAIWFLDDLARRTGSNPGPKGGLSLWGVVGNYTRGDTFVDCLRPFWGELLRNEVGGICDGEHVLVFVEPEQSEATQAFEISLSGDYRDPDRNIEIKHHENLPFSFMQY